MRVLTGQSRVLILFVLLSAACTACDSGGDPKVVSNDLATLPEDTGGTHTAKLLGSTSADFGYYVYLPGGYEEKSHNYPLLIFLHGQPERGNGSSDASVLNKLLGNGPPRLIKDKKWKPEYPMIVVSPQFHKVEDGENSDNWGGGNPAHLKKFIEHVKSTYRVNESRIYLTGLSHGGNGVYDYLTKLDESESYIAAAAPIAAWGASSGFNKSRTTPIWVFVGDKDGSNFSTSVNFVTKYNAQTPAPEHDARISVFKDAGHDVWTRTYDGSGVGKADASYDAFNMSLYDWMLQHTREEE